MMIVFKPFLNTQVKYLNAIRRPTISKRNNFLRKKKNKNNIKTIGYIHSPPLAMPSNFIFKYNSPDKIILNRKRPGKMFY